MSVDRKRNSWISSHSNGRFFASWKNKDALKLNPVGHCSPLNSRVTCSQRKIVCCETVRAGRGKVSLFWAFFSRIQVTFSVVWCFFRFWRYQITIQFYWETFWTKLNNIHSKWLSILIFANKLTIWILLDYTPNINHVSFLWKCIVYFTIVPESFFCHVDLQIVLIIKAFV